MPLFRTDVLEDESIIGIWTIAEDETYFTDRLDLSDEETDTFKRIKGRRRIEWLASRYTLHLLSGRKIRAKISKDEHGKPKLLDSEWHITISHSHMKVAIGASRKSIGIDIQKFVSKIERIAHKFIPEEKLKSLTHSNRIEHMHVIWGAKEAMYKAYGKRELDFIHHMSIEEFDYGQDIRLKGVVEKGSYHKEFNIHSQTIEDYVLVTAIANE